MYIYIHINFTKRGSFICRTVPFSLIPSVFLQLDLAIYKSSRYLKWKFTEHQFMTSYWKCIQNVDWVYILVISEFASVHSYIIYIGLQFAHYFGLVKVKISRHMK